jgi:hypothetical protein
MSGESTPILSNTIPAFELFMTSWEQLAAKHPRLKPWIEIGLAYATTYYAHMDHTSSYIIAMGGSLKLLFVITL